MGAVPKELKRILLRLTKLNSNIPYTEIPYRGFIDDCKEFNYLAATPMHKPTANLILKEINEKLTLIEDKKYKIFNHINHLLIINWDDESSEAIDYSSLGEFYDFNEIERKKGIHIVTDEDRREWYKSLRKEFAEYYSLLKQHGFQIEPGYMISETLASWISTFEIGLTERFLENDSTSIKDFKRLMIDSSMSLEEKKTLKITFGTSNDIISFTLNAFMKEKLLKLSFTEMEILGCFFFKSGSPFKKSNFKTYLSKFDREILKNASGKKNTIALEIEDDIKEWINKNPDNN